MFELYVQTIFNKLENLFSVQHEYLFASLIDFPNVSLCMTCVNTWCYVTHFGYELGIQQVDVQEIYVSIKWAQFRNYVIIKIECWR